MQRNQCVFCVCHECLLCCRFVVDAVNMLLDFIETLEEKLISVRCSPTATERLAQLVSHMTSLRTENMLNVHDFMRPVTANNLSVKYMTSATVLSLSLSLSVSECLSRPVTDSRSRSGEFVQSGSQMERCPQLQLTE